MQSRAAPSVGVVFGSPSLIADKFPFSFGKNPMSAVRVQVVRFVHADFPGFVECELVDVHGRHWLFVEKGPVVTTDLLTADHTYPLPGFIACEVLDRANGVARIDTALPWGIESTEGQTQFEVSEELLLEL